MGFIRPLAVLLVVLVAAWLVLSVALRLMERRRLWREWEAAGGQGDGAAHVEAGMASYRRFLRWLFWLVVVAPMAALGLVLYLVNQA